jgi:hypothetical protein
MLLKLRALPDCSANQLKEGIRKAVQQQASDVSAPSIGPRTLRGRLPSGTRLETGAEQLALESPEDAAAVRYFRSIVEASYLVAGSDGLDANEREAMTQLFAETTGQAVDPSELEMLFARFDELRETEERRSVSPRWSRSPTPSFRPRKRSHSSPSAPAWVSRPARCKSCSTASPQRWERC